MENTFNYKWLVICFFGIVGIIFTISVFYIAYGNMAPDTYWGRKWTLPRTTDTVQPRSPKKVVLELNQATPIDNRIFFYRGRRDDHIIFDVIIPELDRQYPYSFKIRLAEKNIKFETAGIWFQLLAVRGNFVSLKVITE